MSTKAYKPHGKIDYTNTGAAISPNAIVAIGRYVGMALNDIAASTGLGPVATMDIVQVTKTAGTAWTQGLEIFYDSGANSFTTVPTGNTPAGFAALAATSGATTGYVDLCPSWNTFVSPKVVTALLDLNGNELLKVTATTSAVNEITLANAATGGIPSLSATGGDTDVDILVAQKGAAAVQLGAATCTGVQLMADQPLLDSSGNELVKFTKTASAVNELTVANNSTGLGPVLSATGETNVPITLAQKAAAAVILGAASCTGVDLAADQPLRDSSGNELIKFTKTASAVNEITIKNNSTGQVPSILATGETNIGLTIGANGTGTLTLGVATGKVQIGTVGTDYVGFYGVTPAQQPAHVADPAAMAAQTSAALTVTDGAGTNDGTIPAITTGGASADQSAVIAAIQELADQINKLVADVTAAKAGVDANNAAIDSINAMCATLGLTAAS